jgi:hypothetical protein
VLRFFSLQEQISTMQSRIRDIQFNLQSEDLFQLTSELKNLEEQAYSLKPAAEQTIADQITRVLESEGISQSIPGLSFVFPPVNFTLQDPLYLLIVSPRDKIARMKEVNVSQDISSAQMQSLETSLDALNVSSLVIGVGGLGATFPTFVLKNSNLEWTIQTAIHEWLHQYLAFRPLGFRYVLDLLGIARNDVIPTLNETVAGIAAAELGARVYQEFYRPVTTSAPSPESTPAPAGFNFNAAMREIRLAVDAFLAQGQIEQAEKYMEEQRLDLMARGYHIRKLNQAYFAFYGTYADSPASVDPIGDELKLLRLYSGSVKEFLNSAAALTGKQSLQDALLQYKK